MEAASQLPLSYELSWVIEDVEYFQLSDKYGRIYFKVAACWQSK